MKKGIVKFWNEDKGYGFIICDETRIEYYTYQKKLAEGFGRLHNGNKVEFELEEKCGRDRNQIHAVNVSIVN